MAEEYYSSGKTRDSLHCSICFEKYGKNRLPKLFSCAHTYCQICLKGWAEKSKKGIIKCPVCKGDDHRVEELKTNFALWDVIEEANAKKLKEADISEAKESKDETEIKRQPGYTSAHHHEVLHLLSTLKDVTKDVEQSGKVYRNIMDTIRSERYDLNITLQTTTATINSTHEDIVKTATARKKQLIEQLNSNYEKNKALLNAYEDEYNKKMEKHEQFCQELRKDIDETSKSDEPPSCEELDRLIQKGQSKYSSLRHEFQISSYKLSYNFGGYADLISDVHSWGGINQDPYILSIPHTCPETESSLATIDSDQDSLNRYVMKDEVIRSYGPFANMSSPCCVTQLSNQDIAIASSMSYYISIFSSQEKPKIWQLQVPKTALFNSGITGMCTNPSGLLCVSNPDLSEVRILNWSGLTYNIIKVPVTVGRREFDPAGMVCSPKGDLYVCDKANHLVRVFNQSFQEVAQIGGRGKEPGKFNNPSDVALMPDGEIVVADFSNDRIQVFDGKTRAYKRMIAKSGSEVGQLRGPSGIAIDSHGFMAVSEELNHRVQLFTPGGKPFKILGESEGPDHLNKPKGIFITPTREIVICDNRNDRVQVY